MEFCQPEKGKEEDNIWGRECESQHEARQVQEMLSLVTEGCMWRERGRNMGLTGRQTCLTHLWLVNQLAHLNKCKKNLEAHYLLMYSFQNKMMHFKSET